MVKEKKEVKTKKRAAFLLINSAQSARQIQTYHSCAIMQESCARNFSKIFAKAIKKRCFPHNFQRKKPKATFKI
jgi:hypothetical protein